MNFRIRPATLKDCELLFAWVNDPEVRKASFDPNRIEWLDHEIWFEKKIHTPNSHILIFEVDKIPIGQIRFDKEVDGNNFLVSYLISKRFRGKSLSSLLISEGLKYLSKEIQDRAIVIAYVKIENIPSQKSFIKNEFEIDSESHDRIKFIKHIK